MKSKLIILLAALIMLAACSRPQEKRRAEANLENLNLTGLPIVKEKERFSMLIDDNGRAEDKELYGILEEETNVAVDLMLFPYQAALERKNILLASGNYPDVIAGWLITRNDVMRMSREGVIIPLDDLIEKYTVNIREALNLPGVRENMTSSDGRIYSPPYVVEEPLVTFVPWINTTLLSRFALSMPATTGELKQVLITFRDRVPPRGGQKFIPFSADPDNLAALSSLVGWFGINGSNHGSNSGYFAIINGQLENTAIRPEFREFIKYFADLYAEGLIDPEIFTQDLATWRAKGKQDLYGVTIAYRPKDFATELHTDTSRRTTDYEPLPVLRAPGVTRPVFKRNSFGVTIFTSQLVITDRAVNPITIIRWFDNVYGVQRSIETNYGPIGLKFEKLPNGQYREKDTSHWPEDMRKRYEWGQFWTASAPKFLRPEYRVLPPEGREADYLAEDAADALYEPYLEAQPVPILWIAEEKARRAADIEQAIVAYIRQKQAEWISGQANVDAEWDAYVNQINRLGLQELTQIKRDAIHKK